MRSLVAGPAHPSHIYKVSDLLELTIQAHIFKLGAAELSKGGRGTLIWKLVGY